MEYINSRIRNEICYLTLNNLTDMNLLDKFKNSKSVKLIFYNNI